MKAFGKTTSELPELAPAHDAPAEPGWAVPSSVRLPIEQTFGVDLSHARVHADEAAAGAAAAAGALAYADGPDIYFARGQYAPGTRGGDGLIAHELAHVAQGAASGGVQAKSELSEPGQAAELEADVAADAALRRLHDGVPTSFRPTATPEATRMRKPDPAAAKPYDGPKAKGKTTNSSTTVSPDADAGSVTIGKKTTTDEHDKSEDVDKPDKRTTSSESATIDKNGKVGIKSEDAVTENGTTKKKSKGIAIDSDGVEVTSSDTATKGEGDDAVTTGTKTKAKIGKQGVEVTHGAAGDGATYGAKAGPGGASGSYAYKDGKATYSLGGGISLLVEGPTPSDAGWLVTVKRVTTASVGAGHADEGKYGASASGSVSGTSSIQRLFPEGDQGEAAAIAFASSEGKVKALFARDVESAKDARKQMAIGETRGEGTDVAGGVKGSAEVGAVTVEAGISGKHGEGHEIKRVSEDVFEVTRYEDDARTTSAGASATGGGMGQSSTKSSGRKQTYVFNLADKRQAREFENYVQHGTPPKREPKESEQSKGKGDKTDIDLPIMSISEGGTLTETDGVDEHGKQWKKIVGEHELSWASKITNDSHQSSQDFTAVIDQSTGNAAYGMSARSSGTDGSANQEELGKAVGLTSDGRDGVAASGDWTMTSYFTESQIDDICRAVGSGKGLADKLPSIAGAGERLRKALVSGSRTTVDCARAIAIYVKETGPKGLAALRGMAGLDPSAGRDEISLKPKDGSKSPFLGPEGRDLYQRKITAYQGRLEKGEDGATIGVEIGKDLQDLDWRYAEMRHDKYADLPGALLVEERRKVFSLVEVLETIRTNAISGAAGAFEGKLDGMSAATQGKVGAMAEAAGRCGAAESRAQIAFTNCRRRWYQHIETSKTDTRSMRDQFAGYYESRGVDLKYQTAVSVMEACESLARVVESRQIRMFASVAKDGSETTVTTEAAGIAGSMESLATMYGGVADLFSGVIGSLDAIWAECGDYYQQKTSDAEVPGGV